MNINTFISRFFGRDEAESSKNMAKERLRLVLVHDRLDVSEHVMNALRVDLLNVIGKYFGIDEGALEVSLSRETEGMALVANIPIRRQSNAAPLADEGPAPLAATAAPCFGINETAAAPKQSDGKQSKSKK
jgi:cell division topological specificity factor